jgi:hypothetical protein
VVDVTLGGGQLILSML